MKRTAAIFLATGLLGTTSGPAVALPSEAAGSYLERAGSACDALRRKVLTVAEARPDFDAARLSLGLGPAGANGESEGFVGEGREAQRRSLRLTSGRSGDTVICSASVTGLDLDGDALTERVRAHASVLVPGPVVVQSAPAAFGARGRVASYILDQQLFLMVRSEPGDPAQANDPDVVLFIMTWMAPVG